MSAEIRTRMGFKLRSTMYESDTQTNTHSLAHTHTHTGVLGAVCPITSNTRDRWRLFHSVCMFFFCLFFLQRGSVSCPLTPRPSSGPQSARAVSFHPACVRPGLSFVKWGSSSGAEKREDCAELWFTSSPPAHTSRRCSHRFNMPCTRLCSSSRLICALTHKHPSSISSLWWSRCVRCDLVGDFLC